MVETPEISLPDCAAVAVGVRRISWLNANGALENLDRKTAVARLSGGACPFVCHSRLLERRLVTEPFVAFDVLELFAFVRPARFTLPTPKGIAESLGLNLPGSIDAEAEALLDVVRGLLGELSLLATHEPDRGQSLAELALSMKCAGWTWGPLVLETLGARKLNMTKNPPESSRVWLKLPEWHDEQSSVSPDHHAVSGKAALTRLGELLGPELEVRPGQRDYVETCVNAFAPRNNREAPNLVLAEAGTGIGKTLGYIAPASLWAEQNKGTVWISTYTRNLQRQLDAELSRLFPAPAEKKARVVIRKGRENYLCLLNLADASTRTPSQNKDIIILSLMTLWALETRDGDMVGGDFPAWLIDLFGTRLTTGLTDTRGECIYAACEHYRRCFAEHTVRRARRADLVVANHALVMVKAVRAGDEEEGLPTRYVFDEGHQIFNAADNAFSAHLSGREAADLRHWIIGAEQGSRRRTRGLRVRALDIIFNNDEAERNMEEVLIAARFLPARGWLERIVNGKVTNSIEVFLSFVRQQVFARDRNVGMAYGLETETMPLVPGLLDAAADVRLDLMQLEQPLSALANSLVTIIDKEAADLDTSNRTRIEGLIRGIEQRALQPIATWKAMLACLQKEPSAEFVDWFGVERLNGLELDVGYRRHWLDPTRPLAEILYAPAHGVLVTSATLRDHADGDEKGAWVGAAQRTGINHLTSNITEANHPSPFDYSAQTRVLIVGDIKKENIDQVAAAYRELFLAAGGGALGLFTAIHRLRSVYERIADVLEGSGISVRAQHVDAMDTGTLIDIFRAEEDSCLLGTDAVRDGIDIPGNSLRLIVFDRVPWPRPTILHKARKSAFGGDAYDDALARLKLKQAYGRLLRGKSDHGIFVMLDRAMPSRLTSAFPNGVEVIRTGLGEAISHVRNFFLKRDSSQL